MKPSVRFSVSEPIGRDGAIKAETSISISTRTHQDPLHSSEVKMAAVISVIGSLNVDLVTRTKRVPVGGETLTSESFDIGYGGKGANQAVACARLSRSQSQASCSQSTDVEVRMVGAVGDDQFSRPFLESLKKDGLEVGKVEVLKDMKTGVAIIVVETETGQNRIMFNPGANFGLDVTRDLVPDDSTVALFQLEFPMEAVSSLAFRV